MKKTSNEKTSKADGITSRRKTSNWKKLIILLQTQMQKPKEEKFHIKKFLFE